MNNKYITKIDAKKIDVETIGYINKNIRVNPFNRKMPEMYVRHAKLELMDGLY